MEVSRQHLNVAVVGSFCPDDSGKITTNQSDQTLQQRQQFEAACRAIGQALAELGHTIVLCIPTWKPEESKGEGYLGFVTDHVVAGAERAVCGRAQEPHQIILYLTREPCPDDIKEGVIPDALRDKKPLRNVNLICRPLPGPEEFQDDAFPSVSASDAIILVSGEKAEIMETQGDKPLRGAPSEWVAAAAHYVRDLPVVAITSFGGAAQELYRKVFWDHYQELAAEDFAIRDLLGVVDDKWEKESTTAANGEGSGENAALPEKKGGEEGSVPPPKEEGGEGSVPSEKKEGGEGSVLSEKKEGKKHPLSSGDNEKNLEKSLERARRIVELTERLYRAKALKEKRPKEKWYVLVVASIAALLVWICLFTYLGKVDSDPKVFKDNLLLWLALGLAAVLGLLLRTTVAFHSAKVARLEWHILFVDIAAAIVIAIGFGLIYFLGGWSFTNEVKLLGLPSEGTSASPFPSVAAAMSLIGLAAGFLLPVEELSGRLQQLMQPSDSGKAASRTT